MTLEAEEKAIESSLQTAPDNVLVKILKPIEEFFRLESSGGLVLMAAAALAMIVANSPLSLYYEKFLRLPLEIRVGSFGIAKPLLLWINDGLMAVFFFLVGMELKREIVEGHLSSLRQASLPAFAALGGMLAPALIYAAFNWGDSSALNGWAIPTATDIAFAMGVLALLGERVPPALKAFLLSVAIFDDLGAILVIALFYTSELSLLSLLISGVFIAGLTFLNRLHVTKPAAYMLIGIALWVAVLKSGVHATLAGVVLALSIPMRSPASEPLLSRLEHMLHPWVAFGILPVFAFANSGIPVLDLSFSQILHPVPFGIAIGLLIGKPLGILGMCWIAVRLNLSKLPDGMGWRCLHGTAALCGIGFTMSLFIASLAFEQGPADYLGMERLGILMGTLLSAILGYSILRFSLIDPVRPSEIDPLSQSP